MIDTKSNGIYEWISGFCLQIKPKVFVKNIISFTTNSMIS